MPVNRKMMANMKKEYGEKEGENAYYAMENKMKKMHGVKSKHYGSGAFSKSEEAKGYKVLCDASDLNKMDHDRFENVKEYTLASRRESNLGGHKVRRTLRRSESSKGSY